LYYSPAEAHCSSKEARGKAPESPGYCLGETEPRMPIYKYPEYNLKVTEEITNLEI